jgi:vacuolar-type H+-ATPase subunit H
MAWPELQEHLRGRKDSGLNRRSETPFDNIENAQQYIRLLVEAVEEARAEVDDQLQTATQSGPARRRDALQIAQYKLEKLQQHLHSSGRALNDLRSLRRLLLEERAAQESR